MLLAVTMLSAAGLQPAFADEPAARPATTGGDTALTGFEGDGAAASAGAAAATQREDGMYVASGLVYTVADGGLALVSFDGLPEGDDAVKGITVPEAVSVDGMETPVVAVDIAEGQIAESVVALTLSQSINNVSTATLAQAFPNLAAIEIAAPKASAPVAAGAAALRAAYSSFGGVLYRNAWVATDGDASQTTLTKELIWAPPATVVARIPVECTSIAPGAFADVKDLKTVVCFGVMGDIAQTQKADDGTVIPGAFTDEQIQTVNVIVPQTGTVVPDGDHVSADVAVTDVSTMDIKREAWWKSGFASDRITLGEVYGSTTNTLPVNEEGVLETAEAEVAYAPETTQNSSSRKAGIEPPESAIPTPVPDDDELDSSESGLVFTHLADMTLSVSWKGDPTATPAHLDIPAYATINGVTYPVTEIAPEAFKGAVFLTSITIPETIKTIGDSAFEGCTNLSDLELPSALKTMANVTTVESSASDENGKNQLTSSQEEASLPDYSGVRDDSSVGIEAYADTPSVRTLHLWIEQSFFMPSKGDTHIGAGAKIATDYTFQSSMIGHGNWSHAVITVPLNVTKLIVGGDPSGGYLQLMYGEAGDSDAPKWMANITGFLQRERADDAIEYRLGDEDRSDYWTWRTQRGTCMDLSEVYLGNVWIWHRAPRTDAIYARVNSLTNSLNSLTNNLKELNDKVFNADGSSKFATKGELSAKADQSAFNELNDFVKDGSDPLSVESRLVKLEEAVKNGNTGGEVVPVTNEIKKGKATFVLRDLSGAPISGEWGRNGTGAGISGMNWSSDGGSITFDSTNADVDAVRYLLRRYDEYPDLIYIYATGIKDGSETGMLDMRCGIGQDTTAYAYSTSGAAKLTSAKGSFYVMDATSTGTFESSIIVAPSGTSDDDGYAALRAATSDYRFDTYSKREADGRFAFKSDFASLRDSIEALKATAGVAGGNTFFADAALDSSKGGSDPWESTIAVKLADSGAAATKATGVRFAANDQTGLLADQGKVSFAVGPTESGVAGSHGFGDSGFDAELGEVPGGKGIWVKITIEADGIDAGKVMTWQTAKAYVASIAKLHYDSLA